MKTHRGLKAKMMKQISFFFKNMPLSNWMDLSELRKANRKTTEEA